jgi:hypothetical protein
MILQHLASDRFEVWAACDDQGICQVVEMLQSVQSDYPRLAAEMGALLLRQVPEHGPPYDDPQRFGRLYDDLIYELKGCEYDDPAKRKHKKVGLRVAFFFDGTSRIICTNAFYKTRRTPPAEKARALRERERYFAEGTPELRGWS